MTHLSPLEHFLSFVRRCWPERTRALRGADAQDIARLQARVSAALPAPYLRFLRLVGGELPPFGLFKVGAMTVADVLKFYAAPPPGACPPDHLVIGIGRDPLGAPYLIMPFEKTSDANDEWPYYCHYPNTEVDPDLQVSAYFEDSVAADLFDYLALQPCRHFRTWSVPTSPEAIQQFLREDPAPLVSTTLAEAGLSLINENVRCAMYSDGKDRHAIYELIPNTPFFILKVGCHTADESVQLEQAIQSALGQELVEE